ncbi:MAG: hypothetical protein KKD44_17345 [Proteobacteria bacterium]|nr:hypothetical protein [Pseudomonadota bacterium]
MKPFEPGKTYWGIDLCNGHQKVQYTIERRTDKSVWVNGKRFKLFSWKEDGGAEYIYTNRRCSKDMLLTSIKEVMP